MKKLALVFAAIVGLSGVANALSLNIEVGDRPYYVHGARWWNNGAYWCWVPGHWNHYHHWVHGHYRPC